MKKNVLRSRSLPSFVFNSSLMMIYFPSRKAKGQVMDVKERLSLTGFAELNRWSNEWKELPQPGSEPETAEPQEASVTEVIE